MSPSSLPLSHCCVLFAPSLLSSHPPFPLLTVSNPLMQVWVDLNNTQGFNEGKLLLWVCPPPGSVYPDTLANRRIVLEVPTSPLAIMDDSSTYKPVFKGQFKPINTTEALPVASQPAADVPGKTSEPPTSGRASQSSAAATAHTYGNTP